jgi:tripartite-type tricarboxylate transporter receptor subunit TctC
MRAWMRVAAVLASLMALVPGARAEEAFPSRAVHVFVPYPPGGAVDIIARTLGDELSKRWGQPVVIENRPGAGATIAEAATAKSTPDGYTIVLVASGHSILPYLYAKLSYDPLNDLVPISLVATSTNMVLVRADSPFKTVGDMLAAAKAGPGKLSYGHPGNGTSPHLSGELLKYMAKVDIAAVPYKGGAPSLNDLLGGHIPMSINNIPESIAQVRAGSVRILGVTTGTRSPFLPDVPAIAEAVPGFDTGMWWGFLAPAGLPADVKAKLAKDCAEVVKLASIQERFNVLGAAPVGSTPEAFDAVIRADYEKWGPVIKAAGIHGE